MIFLISDGEEPALLGAQAFAEGDPLMASVEAVVNLEARGTRGPAVFFESNQPNADAVAAFAHAPRGIANSVMADVYGLLQNSTDVTALRRPGLDIVDHRTFAFCSEGDMMEGISSEAASLAGRLHLGLGKLTVFFDSNHITLEGAADVEFAENVGGRFDAYGWHVAKVSDVNALNEIDQAIAAAIAETSRPSLVIVHSHIGYGTPVADTPKAHGEPLGPEGVKEAKRFYGWPEDAQFLVPDGVLEHFAEGIGGRGREAREAWEARFEEYRAAYPDLADEVERMQRRELPDGWDAGLEPFPADERVVEFILRSGDAALPGLRHPADNLD